MNPTTDESMQPTAEMYQPLQLNQRDKDVVYDRISKTRTELAYERVQRTNQEQHEYQSLELNQGRSDESNQGMSKKGEEHRNTEAAIKRMKIILLATVIINIVILLLVTIAVIVGGIKIQSNIVDINSDISLISSQLEAAINDLGELAVSTHHNISLISRELSATNGNLTFALNKTDTIQGRISNITAQLHITNITSTQAQLATLQRQTTILQTQLGYIHPCGAGEWHSVAYLNMGNMSHRCPLTWRQYNSSGVRACGRPDIGTGFCASIRYSVDGLQYRKVCGRVLGYQFGSTDAFNEQTINQQYVDGVSITHGSPRQHIWTYAAGSTVNGSDSPSDNCPCSSTPGLNPPSFVGNNYYCESANPTATFQHGQLFLDDKLWDGQQCENTCCTAANSQPWFTTNLPQPTSDAIEVRICGSETVSREDIYLQLLEIYIQ